jgi:hypothetical protein
MAGRSPFWARRAHADRRPVLIARSRTMAALREWFAARDFVEVETAALQVSPGNETHLHAFATELVAPGGPGGRRYLRTSPEFACKKLLSAGEPRIVEFARVFRNRERGALHAPEFTMLEWYRAQAHYQALMEDCAAIIAVAAQAAGTRRLTFRGREADAFAVPEHLTVAEAFARYAAIDLTASLTPQPASGSPPTTAGATSSAACWWSASSHAWASAVPPCCTSIRPRSRPWRGRRRPTRALRSGSRSMPAGSSSPTALASSPTQPNNDAGLSWKWTKRNEFTANGIRSMRIFWQRSPTCRQRAALRSGSTGW